MGTPRRTPLYAEHLRHQAKLVEFAGFMLPLLYTSIKQEHLNVRRAAGLFDVSHMGELRLSGPRALSLANSLITNDLNRISDGQALYTCCCNANGGILDDLICYRTSPSEIMIVCNAANRTKIVQHFSDAATRQSDCHLSDVSDETALIALQGPVAWTILDAAGTAPSPLELKPFRFASVRVHGIPCTVARTGYTGEDGAELFCAAEDAGTLWRALVSAGAAHGLMPAGLGARDTLRLEARLSLYGNEIDETTDPFEAGLGWTVKLGKSDFVGKTSLEQKRTQSTRKLVGFEMVGRGVARHGYALLDTSEKRVGTCTSGAPSPTLGKNIGLGYLPLPLADEGSEFLVDCRGKPIPARVVKTPFYKRARPS